MVPEKCRSDQFPGRERDGLYGKERGTRKKKKKKKRRELTGGGKKASRNYAILVGHNPRVKCLGARRVGI